MLALEIAFKFHRSCGKNIFISLVSLISIIGITIGFAVTITALSVINGFENELDKRILSIIPHIEIIPINTPFSDWKIVLEKIQHIPNITHVNPYINFPGIIELNNKWHVLQIKSTNLIEYCTTNHCDHKLTNFIEEKSWKYFCKRKNQIILGKGISNALNIKTGDWITILFVQNSTTSNKLLTPKKIKVQVSGILNLRSQLDENLAILSLSNAQAYCNNRSDIDGIEIMIQDVFYVDRIVKKIKQELHTNVCIRSWIDIYGYIYQDIQIVRLIIYLSVTLIIGISCFNVIAMLMLSIKNKCYDIAVLKAIGASNYFIQCIFIWYGLIIYVVSSILGSGLGMFIVINLKKIDIISIEFFGRKIFPKGIYFIDFIPVYFNKWHFFYVLSTVLLLGLLVSWFISFKTKNIHLAQILK